MKGLLRSLENRYRVIFNEEPRPVVAGETSIVQRVPACTAGGSWKTTTIRNQFVDKPFVTARAVSRRNTTVVY